jgi:hypothetical protein
MSEIQAVPGRLLRQMELGTRLPYPAGVRQTVVVIIV